MVADLRNIPSSLRRSRAAEGEVPTLIPTLLALASTNRTPASTFKSLLRVVTPVTPTVPPILKLEDPPASVSEPVMVSPVFNTLSDAAPDNEPVIVPAEKLPEPSLLTAVFAILLTWKVMLPAFHTVEPLTSKPSALATLTSNVPEPSVVVPPAAIKATL